MTDTSPASPASPAEGRLRIALVQQAASDDRPADLRKGLDAVDEAAARGAQVICFAELAFDPFYPQEPATEEKLGASHARRLFLRDRRPELYGSWLG